MLIYKLNKKENIFSEKIVFPCIAVLSMSHYVVIEKAKRGTIYYLDPECGRIIMDGSEFSKKFTGILLLFFPENIKKQKSQNKIIEILTLGEIKKKNYSWCYIFFVYNTTICIANALIY